MDVGPEEWDRVTMVDGQVEELELHKKGWESLRCRLRFGA